MQGTVYATSEGSWLLSANVSGRNEKRDYNWGGNRSFGSALKTAVGGILQTIGGGSDYTTFFGGSQNIVAGAGGLAPSDSSGGAFNRRANDGTLMPAARPGNL